MPKLVESQVELKLQNCNVVLQQYRSSCEDALSQLSTIRQMLENNTIRIKFGDADTKARDSEHVSMQSDTSSVDRKSDTQKKKKRGKGTKDKKGTILEETNPELSDSNSSTKSQRAAAQAAGQKMAQVHSFMKATKLRRPTDFNEKQRRRDKTSSPPAKTRKTYQQQSAGSSQDKNEINDDENKENNLNSESDIHLVDNNILEIDSKNIADLRSKNECTVSIKKLTNSAIKSHMRYRSLESILQKNTSTINDADVCETMYMKTTNKIQVSEALVKSTEDLFQVDDRSSESEDEFNGFELQDNTVKCNIPVHDTYVKEINSDSEKNELLIAANQDFVSITTFEMEIGYKEELAKIGNEKLTTKDLSKNENVDKTNQIAFNENIYETEKQNDVSSKEHYIQQSVPNDEKRDDIQDFESESVVNNLEAYKEVINKNCNDECDSDTSESNIRSRTKVIKKQNEVNNLEGCKEVIRIDTNSNDECESDSPENEVRSRTKVIKKHYDVSDNECQSQPKTIRNKKDCNDLESTSLATLSKEDLLSKNKLTTEASNKSPFVPKGKVVKQRVKEFENLGKPVKETTGVITRHTAKNRNLPSKAVTPVNPVQTRAHQVNKKLNSATRPVPIENNAAVVQKQVLEEIEKKKREEEIRKRQAKEEIAIKKKEKKLKATVEDARRKREEKLTKAAAAREAAEREKHALSYKAEKEKMAKMQLLAAEKEKLKEEHLKMKQLAKQKALEHEERRKHEEAARIARLKEQEEEHKRLLAMRERELELKKQAKDNEIRLAENDKAKYKGTKLCKVASGTSANSKLQQGMKPTNQQPCQSYDITPAREDRPLLEPKSENDYGIDHANSGDSSEDESQPKKKIPLWADAKVRHHLLKVSSLLPKEIWPLFMECSANPDVNEIFSGNPIRKRVRTSSAVWNTPPRVMPS